MSTYRKRISTPLIGILLLALAGCVNIFNPPTFKDGGSPIVRGNNNPRSVLENLEVSYNQQDIDLFKNCLSESFRFVLLASEAESIGVDMDGDGIKDSWWDYHKEVEYHRNLFTDGSSDGSFPPPDNIHLNLQIPQEEFWLTDNQEGREDWIIIPVYFQLNLTVYTSSNISADGFARFYLRPEGEEWRIVIWRDESNI
ncbi:MAG: hypothetical protein WCX83_02465 [Candidatus Cloacimonas sp.]|nr:hypothetical protein [Candidatus Cloacimonadota bacterium]